MLLLFPPPLPPQCCGVSWAGSSCPLQHLPFLTLSHLPHLFSHTMSSKIRAGCGLEAPPPILPPRTHAYFRPLGLELCVAYTALSLNRRENPGDLGRIARGLSLLPPTATAFVFFGSCLTLPNGGVGPGFNRESQGLTNKHPVLKQQHQANSLLWRTCQGQCLLDRIRKENGTYTSIIIDFASFEVSLRGGLVLL